MKTTIKNQANKINEKNTGLKQKRPGFYSTKLLVKMLI